MINSTVLKRIILYYSLIIIFSFSLGKVQAQALNFLPDSTKQALAKLPESMHDSVYRALGASLYLINTIESHSQALDCYAKALHLAEKYQHKKLLIDITHATGNIYDAKKNLPDQILYYYKKTYELSTILHDSDRINYAFDVAYAYGLLQDTIKSLSYLNIVKEYKEKLYKKDSEQWDNINLMIANLTRINNQMTDFMRLFESVNQNRIYVNGRFPYYQYFTFCAWEYYFQKGDQLKAIEIASNALKTNLVDSIVLLNNMARAYAKGENYKEAYNLECFINKYKDRTLKASLEKDLTVKLLKTENKAKEREQLLKEKQNKYLLGGLILSLLAVCISVYFWRANHKSKKEKVALLEEMHHRVKNNLQLLYSLASLQLPTITDEKARELWEKNLIQLKAITLVNEKLYHTEGVTKIDLKDFITEIEQHFNAIQNGVHNIIFQKSIPNNLTVSSEFAVPFGLILSELIVNSYKYAFENKEKPFVGIHITKTEKKGIVFNYDDSGKVSDLSVILNKKEGGASIIRDLVRQLKGTMTVNNEPSLQYTFSFSI
jgi:two-component sensor histidine kinase